MKTLSGARLGGAGGGTAAGSSTGWENPNGLRHTGCRLLPEHPGKGRHGLNRLKRPSLCRRPSLRCANLVHLGITGVVGQVD